MTLAQVTALQAAGNEIGGHTVDHANLPALSADQARREICDDRVALLGDGFVVTSFAYPFGATDASVRQFVIDCGYNSARLVGGLVNPDSCQDCPYADTRPPVDPFGVRTNDSVKADTPLAQVEGYVTNAEQHGGGWVPLLFHHVCDGCDSLSITPANLDAFMTWLAARGPATEVGTVADVIGGGTPPPAGNLLQNPSLEVDANGDGVPDCWQPAGFGASAATFARVTDAADGSFAETVKMTSFTSGARRLVSKQDLGTCAPAALPGHRYAVSASYKATTQPIFTIYYRTAAGGWVWFAQSAPLATASAYTRATYTTPPMPAAATGISIALSLVGTGTLTSDAYELVDLDAP